MSGPPAGDPSSPSLAAIAAAPAADQPLTAEQPTSDPSPSRAAGRRGESGPTAGRHAGREGGSGPAAGRPAGREGGSGRPAGRREAAGGGRAPTAVDMVGSLDQVMSEARPVAEGGAWVSASPGARAEAAAGGRPAGPLERTIVAVKDLVAVAGLPVGAGSRTRAGARPEPRDAVIVARLRAAGAVVAGTVALHELAFGVSGVNEEIGFPPHPHDPTRIPGGSSSGSAVAVALGAADLAVGTDTGGSVRIPAALCGVVGFKPSRGRYPLDGVLPLAPTLDHVGFLAGTVADVAAAHRAVTGEAVEPTGPAAQLRLGVDRAGLAAADAPVAAAVESALRSLAAAGCELVEVDWPDRAEVLDVSTTILFAEAAAVHRQLLAGPGAELLGPAILARLRSGAALSEADHRQACAAAQRLEDRMRAALATVDAVVGPTVPIQAPTIGEARTNEALPRRLVADTRLANITGAPALTVPVPVPPATTAPGPRLPLPVGLQVTATTDAHTLSIGGLVASLIANPQQDP